MRSEDVTKRTSADRAFGTHIRVCNTARRVLEFAA
jgi:hypothetical protein